MQIDESLARNAARRVEPHQTHGATRVHREAPGNNGEVDPYPIRHGRRRIVLLEVAASGRVEPRSVKLPVSTRPISASGHLHRVPSPE